MPPIVANCMKRLGRTDRRKFLSTGKSLRGGQAVHERGTSGAISLGKERMDYVERRAIDDDDDDDKEALEQE